MFTILGVLMLYRKNFAQLDYRMLFCFTIFTCLPLVFIIFTFIGPKNPWHYVLALIIFIGGTIVQYLIINLYEDCFKDNHILNVYSSIVDTMVFFVGIMIFTISISFIVGKISKKYRPISLLMGDTMAIAEFVHLTLYGILLYMFSTFVALPDIV